MKFFVFLILSLFSISAFSYQPIPSGMVITFAGSSCPSGYLLTDGSSLLRVGYPNLFSAIGTAHGASDGSHFNLPDYRGRALRGVDNGAGLDTFSRTAMASGGNSSGVGSVQTDATARRGLALSDPGHNHSITDPGHSHSLAPIQYYGGGGAGNGGGSAGGAIASTSNNITGIIVNSNSSNVSLGAGDSETVMKNAAVNFCIKI